MATAPNLEKLNVADLKALIADAQAMIAKKQKEERKAALAEAKKIAAERGFSLEELLSKAPNGRAKRGSKRDTRPKFRHPENPDLTWSGMGRKPRWIVEAEAEGKLEEMRIAD